MAQLVALISGIIFGLGLAVSGMVNPAKVIGFLDVTGDWDPSLAFVMG
ncbi:MAG: YeeE/YedE family protein, partial [Rhodospirillaceae bacterium]|nr:YeeE/YedE family protein [Rhodospirillaceae bacterium]